MQSAAELNRIGLRIENKSRLSYTRALRTKKAFWLLDTVMWLCVVFLFAGC